MAFLNRSVLSASIATAGITQNTITLTKGGILLALNASWIGTELIDPAGAGTANELFKPGDMVFSASAGTQGVIGLANDVIVVPQATTYTYLHPEYNDIKACGYLAGMSPNSNSLGLYQGLIMTNGAVTLTTFSDDAPYTPSGALAGRHRLLYEIEFLLFE
mgnify:CR=1 FL=1